jgi:hypothetical protein
MLCSDYCKYAPPGSIPDFEHMKKQMYKVHLPHRESGYIVKVYYQQTLDGEGSMDWEMFYTPGPKAHAEYQAFTSRQTRQQLPAMAALQSPAKSLPVQASLDLSEADNTLRVIQSTFQPHWRRMRQATVFEIPRVSCKVRRSIQSEGSWRKTSIASVSR